MILSNLFLALPVFFAGIYKEWLYMFFAGGILVFSTLYHWYKITNPTSPLFIIFKSGDWLFAVSAFIYMYYFIYSYVPEKYKIILFILLSFVVIFFLYGWLFGNYSKMHPWFHVVAPIVSSLILIAVGTQK